jgi:hypothetical protein
MSPTSTPRLQRRSASIQTPQTRPMPCGVGFDVPDLTRRWRRRVGRCASTRGLRDFAAFLVTRVRAAHVRLRTDNFYISWEIAAAKARWWRLPSMCSCGGPSSGACAERKTAGGAHAAGPPPLRMRSRRAEVTMAERSYSLSEESMRLAEEAVL